MSIESRKQLKEWFTTGARPTEAQFYALLDSYLHKDEYDIWDSNIQAKITKLSKQISNFLDVDDTTVDQLSEIIELIESNSDVSSALANTISVNDIVDNIETYLTDKPLSAKQGAILKGLIDDIEQELNNNDIVVANRFQQLETSVSGLDNNVGNLSKDVNALSQSYEAEKADNEIKFAQIGERVEGINASTNTFDKKITDLEQSTNIVEQDVIAIDNRLLNAENKITQLEQNAGGAFTIHTIEKGDVVWGIDTKGRTYTTMNISADTEVVITTADSKSDGYEHYLLLWNNGEEAVDVALAYTVGGVPTVIIGESSTVSVDAGGFVEVSVIKVTNYGLVMTMSSNLRGSN